MAQTHKDSPTVIKPAKRPMELGVRMGWYILKNGCGAASVFLGNYVGAAGNVQPGLHRLRAHPGVSRRAGQNDARLTKRWPPSTIPGRPLCHCGGEPTIHPQIDEIINTLVAGKYFVYCCTNALLLPRMLEKIPPSKYFCWVIHMDGMAAKHDESVARAGVFQRAVDGIQMAVARGYRVCTNTTVFSQQRR